MPTLSEQQLATIPEQLAHFEEMTQGHWKANDESLGVVWSSTILSLIKSLEGLHLQQERFNWYKRFKIPMKLASFECEFLLRDEELSPLAYCEAVTAAIGELGNSKHPFEMVNVRLLLNKTGEMMADE
jgi:hypothetical protein